MPDPLALLAASQNGDGDASATLYDTVYAELRRLAQRIRRGRGSATLNTTALVHEAYLKLADGGRDDFEGRAHFLGIAAKAMRHVLIDYARKQATEKRGGDVEKLPLRETLVGEAPPEDLLALDEAMERLERVDARAARIVECRFFGGLTIEETAAALNVSTPTIERGWRTARTWLYRDLRDG